MKYGNEVDCALIDGDIVVYRSACAAEHKNYILEWEGGGEVFAYKRELNKFVKDNEIEEYSIDTTVEIDPLEYVFYSMKNTIGKIISATKPGDFKIFLTTGDNFRHKAATIMKYKGNRDNTPRPKHYADARKFLLKYYDTDECIGIEADDALANEQTDRTVICSIDKDLLQVPGKHFDWIKDKKVLVTPEQGLLSLWCQVLTGDGTDNIPGIKGIGPVTAKKLLESGIDKDTHYNPDLTQAEEYAEVCYQQWDKYLRSDNPPKWLSSYEHGGGPIRECLTYGFRYPHWNGEDKKYVNAKGIVDEIYALVKVGT